MPQTTQLFSPFRATNKAAVPGWANDQGLLIQAARPGNVFFVNSTLGDNDNPGTIKAPFATLDAALAACSANNNDAVCFWGTQARTSTLTWNKNNVDLIGLQAPSQASRNRITGTGTVFTPLVNVTAQGCRFVNVATFYGFDSATAQIAWQELGGRNSYDHVQFCGGGHATAAAQAGMRSLIIGGEGENNFDECTFGLDTVPRATNANATLEFVNSGGQGQRNVFNHPVFRMQSALAGNLHILALAGATDRFQEMHDAVFHNGVNSTATQITVAVSWAASASLLLSGYPMSVGAAKIATGQPVYVAGPAGNAAGGLGVAAG